MNNPIILLAPYFLLAGAIAGNVIVAYRDRRGAFFFVFLLVFCWLMSWNTVGGPDYQNYYIRYHWVGYPSKQFFALDIGYTYISHLFRNKLNLSFNVFRAVIFGVGYYLIGRTIWKCSSQPNFVLLIYFFTLMAVDTVQIRNFVASSFLICALQQILSKRYFRSFLLILISSLFHKTFLIYLCIPILVLIGKDIGPKNTLIISVAIYLVMFLLQMAKPYIHEGVANLVTNYPIFSKIFNSESKSRYGHWLLWGYQSYTIILFFLYLPVKDTMIERDSVSLFSTALSINLAMVLLFPLFFIDGTISRIYRNVFIFNVIGIFEAYKIADRKNIYRIGLIVFYLLLAFFCFSAATNCVPPLFLESRLFRIKF